jgi:hypothetical protein
MSFAEGQFGRRAASRIVAGVAALAGLSAGTGYAADFNQSLNVWQAAERARQESIAQAPPAVAPTSEMVLVPPAKPGTKPPKALPKGLNAPPPSEAVSKLLAPSSADPSVPLPRADLARQNPSGDDPSDSPMAGPRVYGRPEQGNNGGVGLVMGVKIPIPADRNAAVSHTISGGGPTGSESSGFSR